jgi:hypothetical protein
MPLYMTKDEQIELLLTKGVEQILPSAEFVKTKLLADKKTNYILWF